MNFIKFILSKFYEKKLKILEPIFLKRANYVSAIFRRKTKAEFFKGNKTLEHYSRALELFYKYIFVNKSKVKNVNKKINKRKILKSS